MNKYIKLEDAEKLLTNALRIAQGFDEPLERSLVDLPTIEVSEDCDSCIWNSCNYNKVPWEVSEDCISREFALKVIDDCINYPTNGDKACAIKNAPSVLPKPKEGKRSRCIWCDSPYRIEYNWIDREGNTASFADEDRHLVATGIANYCPNCGAKMKGAD